MNVSELMTSNPRAVRAYDNLAVAAAAMWEDDCGALPVLDDTDRVTGIITDRDICMALTTRNRPASEVAVGEVIGRPPITCRENDTTDQVLEIMRSHQVRRVPVVDDYGRLHGIISINDAIIASTARKAKDVITHADVMETLKGICGHADLPTVSTTTAGAVIVSGKKSKSGSSKKSSSKKELTKSSTNGSATTPSSGK